MLNHSFILAKQVFWKCTIVGLLGGILYLFSPYFPHQHFTVPHYTRILSSTALLHYLTTSQGHLFITLQVFPPFCFHSEGVRSIPCLWCRKWASVNALIDLTSWQLQLDANYFLISFQQRFKIFYSTTFHPPKLKATVCMEIDERVEK